MESLRAVFAGFYGFFHNGLNVVAVVHHLKLGHLYEHGEVYARHYAVIVAAGEIVLRIACGHAASGIKWTAAEKIV